MDRIVIAVCSADTLLLTGVSTLLRGRSELAVVPGELMNTADVVVAVVDDDDQVPLDLLRHIARTSNARTVLVTDQLGAADPALLASCRVVSVISRRTMSAELLVEAVEEGMRVPLHPQATQGDLVLRLRRAASRLDDVRTTATSITARERALLELLAAGHDTAEIALHLSYSERTVKKIVHQLLSRFELRNRAHAVAFAHRSGALQVCGPSGSAASSR